MKVTVVSTEGLNQDPMGALTLSRNSTWVGDISGAPNHSGVSGIWVNWIFSTNHVGWEPRGLPLGEIGVAGLSAPVQGVYLRKEALVFGRGALIFVIPIYVHVNPKPARKWRDTIIHAGGNIGVVFPSFFLSVFLSFLFARTLVSDDYPP